MSGCSCSNPASRHWRVCRLHSTRCIKPHAVAEAREKLAFSRRCEERGPPRGSGNSWFLAQSVMSTAWAGATATTGDAHGLPCPARAAHGRTRYDWGRFELEYAR